MISLMLRNRVPAHLLRRLGCMASGGAVRMYASAPTGTSTRSGISRRAKSLDNSHSTANPSFVSSHFEVANSDIVSYLNRRKLLFMVCACARACVHVFTMYSNPWSGRRRFL
jgi:hypothetical protein